MVGRAARGGTSVYVAVAQRDALFPPRRAALYGLLIVLPFVLDAVGLALPFRIGLPLWIFPIPVLVGTALLVFNPVEVDFAAFSLVFVAAVVAARDWERMWFGIAVALAGMGVMAAADYLGPYDDSFVWFIGIGFGWFGGFLVQRMTLTAAELTAAQAGLAESAAAEERSRIAREVHDVIAHSMSVTMLHVTAARMALEKGRSSEALESLREAEGQGRNSLIDIRRTVGLLGSDESASAPPMPGVLDLPKLVDDFKSAGLDVTLSMDGAVDELPPAAGLNLYRIVQESLTNASKHAPGAKTSVELNVTDTDIRLRVFNEAGNGNAPTADAGGGRGFRGMAERAVMLNGSLMSGSELGGWLVFLAAPRPTE
jgi:signal transduction histidine kinase